MQLPMRLVIRKPDSPSYSVTLRELNYENAPGFTGSDESVSFKLAETGPQADGGAVFQVTAREIRDAVNAEPGDYELHWLIYHGSGDMNYQAVCQSVEINAEGIPQASESTLPGEYRDRRNGGIGGGFGTFETTDVVAAKVSVKSEPLPFLAMGSNIGHGADGLIEIRAATGLLGYPAHWRSGESGGAQTVLSFYREQSFTRFVLGHRLLGAYEPPARCACLAADDGHEVLRWYSGAALWQVRLEPGAEAGADRGIGSPPKPIYHRCRSSFRRMARASWAGPISPKLETARSGRPVWMTTRAHGPWSRIMLPTIRCPWSAPETTAWGL
ncbi:MAG: hypothetical protein MZV65_43730 [Chromatiales bacterium]|nr:hypothetical protein [Chromatiales bacterium]